MESVIDLNKNLRIRIVCDDCPANPLSEFDTLGSLHTRDGRESDLRDILLSVRNNVGDDVVIEIAKLFVEDWPKFVAEHQADYPDDSENDIASDYLGDYVEESDLWDNGLVEDVCNLGGAVCVTASIGGDDYAVYVSKKRIAREYGDRPDALETAKTAAESELSTFRQWCEGDVYGYVIERRCENGDGWECVDSCCGFYGPDPVENGMIENWDDETRKAYLAVV